MKKLTRLLLALLLTLSLAACGPAVDWDADSAPEYEDIGAAEQMPDAQQSE